MSEEAQDQRDKSIPSPASTLPIRVVPGTLASSNNSSPESSQGRQDKPHSILDRIFTFKSKGLNDLLLQDMKIRTESDNKTKKQAEEHARKAQGEADDKASGQKHRASKDNAQQYSTDKKSKKAEEKKTKQQYDSGVFWGFDPNAGRLPSESRNSSTAKVGAGLDKSLLQPSEILNPRPVRGETWGVQHGKPNKYDRFGVDIHLKDEGGSGSSCG
ncbi:hypothetical protein LTR99_005999 [Exophiala xenobiotica]|uniref:Pre-mRNA-splicing factor CWC26 n=1 Tax=Vermiconidia calcicola TaxID=1690605 RepID=A0AAV9QHG8_9PEZI|nr:hypothetical protein LTR92_006112 [Exophiala xenobiotica]KAK5540929.1 hypothetical protein LTR25_002706 [Vermiconidia calcicola]KAK5549580.1 hypothetical protein LTR23_000688 [Chaetothyriales sp. CCFEE 6169]KAK5222987.1 hypothetical protein LTR72_005824 [Exophiala xenobiotica]KAK5267042.1 hypothetical protein LTR96_007709 [Exophiala xenobiotica]